MQAWAFKYTLLYYPSYLSVLLLLVMITVHQRSMTLRRHCRIHVLMPQGVTMIAAAVHGVIGRHDDSNCCGKCACAADLLKMTTLSAISKASSWSCVTRMLVTPTLCMMSFTESRSVLRTYASKKSSLHAGTAHLALGRCSRL